MPVLIIVLQKPRAWNLQALQVWLQSVFATKDFIYFIYCLTFVSSNLQLRCQYYLICVSMLEFSFQPAPIISKFLLISQLLCFPSYVEPWNTLQNFLDVISANHPCTGTPPQPHPSIYLYCKSLFDQFVKILCLFNRKYLEELCVWVESNTTTLSILSSQAEIGMGFLLTISLFSSVSKLNLHYFFHLLHVVILVKDIFVPVACAEVFHFHMQVTAEHHTNFHVLAGLLILLVLDILVNSMTKTKYSIAK